MALVVLEGMRFHAFHGVYPEEQLLGTEYIVNVEVETGIALAAKTDLIDQATVNYETVFQICMAEMAQPRLSLLTSTACRPWPAAPLGTGSRVSVMSSPGWAAAILPP